jgi:hypothetical protein
VRIEVRDESSFNPNRYPNIGKTKTAPPKKNPKKNVDYASRLIEAAEVRFFLPRLGIFRRLFNQSQ